MSPSNASISIWALPCPNVKLMRRPRIRSGSVTANSDSKLPSNVATVPHADEDLLEHVIHVIVAQQPPRQRLHAPDVPSVDALERQGIAADGELHVNRVLIRAGPIEIVRQGLHSTPAGGFRPVR